MFLHPLLLNTLTAAYILPSPSPSPSPPKSNKCTFTLLHRQQHSTTYIHLTTITDHANALTIDVASHRPPTAFNSYTRLSPTHAFAVAGLLEEQRLTISSAEAGILSFQVGDAQWRIPDAASSQGNDDVDRVGCEVGAWFQSGRRSQVCDFVPSFSVL
ncbi:hypothetical protein ST47_g2267 [Ascochyta rabiei]|uniref:Uncharacterized protein n=1 Tax=Didymella rabiei TaxID=5454 RepID=A0A163JMK5_DIDRA|nr:hypothetical protein ST47_g2267 [Ascochyta rabiei]